MRYNEILEYTTRSGEDIAFKYKEDVEGDDNRGWVVHQINAYVKGEHAGYLKISYITKDRFVKHYPTILNYLTTITGNIILPFDKKSAHYKDLNDSDLKSTVKALTRHSRSRKYHDMWNTGKGIPESRKELLFIIEDIIKIELKDKKKKFKEFIEYHVDKPIVDFIKVFKKDEVKSKYGDDTSKQNFQRQYIGTALYLEAADWLKNKGLKLYASGSQTDAAQGAWIKLEKEGYVALDGDRRYVKI